MIKMLKGQIFIEGRKKYALNPRVLMEETYWKLNDFVWLSVCLSGNLLHVEDAELRAWRYPARADGQNVLSLHSLVPFRTSILLQETPNFSACLVSQARTSAHLHKWPWLESGTKLRLPQVCVFDWLIGLIRRSCWSVVDWLLLLMSAFCPGAGIAPLWFHSGIV